MKFKIAILQKKSKKHEINENKLIVIESMKKVAFNEADILLLPECFLTSYDLPISMEDAISMDDDCIREIYEAAVKYKIGVVLTAAVKGSKKPQNTALVIDKNGKLLLSYSKVHTCDFADESCFESGDDFKVCDFHGVKLG